jgi:hypothetical protein
MVQLPRPILWNEAKFDSAIGPMRLLQPREMTKTDKVSDEITEAFSRGAADGLSGLPAGGAADG